MFTESATKKQKEFVIGHGDTVTPELVLEKAKPKNSIIHDLFTWDNDTAGNLFRLEQARGLLRICVRYIDDKGNITDEREPKSEPVKAFHVLNIDRTSDGKGKTPYRSVDSIMKNENLRRELLMDAYLELRNFQRKYWKLTELKNIFDDIEKFEKSMAKKAG